MQRPSKRSLLDPPSEHSLTGSEASTVTCLQESHRQASRISRCSLLDHLQYKAAM